MVINGKAYFPKNDLDRLLPPKIAYNPNDWYDAYDLMRSEGLTRKYISDFIRRKEVPCRRNGRSLLIARREWDNARTSRGTLSSSYLTVESAGRDITLARRLSTMLFERTTSSASEKTDTHITISKTRIACSRTKSPGFPQESAGNTSEVATL